MIIFGLTGLLNFFKIIKMEKKRNAKQFIKRNDNNHNIKFINNKKNTKIGFSMITEINAN